MTALTPRTQTFAIIKPDAVAQHAVGPILALAAEHGLHPVAMAMLRPERVFWREFYADHYGKPFYEELIEFMASGPSVFLRLEGYGAVQDWRDLMGATDPAKAAPNTIRRRWGRTGPENAVHGSDSLEAVVRESWFFNECYPGAGFSVSCVHLASKTTRPVR